MKRILGLDTCKYIVYGFLKTEQVGVEFTVWAKKPPDRINAIVDKENFDLVAMVEAPDYSQWRDYFKQIGKPICWVSLTELKSYQNQYRYSGHYANATALADFVSEASYIF
jgi:hypothetical protein